MPESTKPSSSKVRRVLGVVGGVAVVLLLAWIFFHKSNTWSGWIRDAKDKEALKNLRQETDPGLVSKLESALYDADYPRESRVIAGRLLIEKEQRALVEKALTAPALDPRTIAIEVLSRDSFFGKQYADDPAYRVHETLLEWLKGDARTDADAAFAVLSRMVPPGGKLEGDVLAAVRALLASTAPKVRTEAAKTLAAYRDCESAAQVLELAGRETDAISKLRLMQVLSQQFWDAGGDECRAKLTEEAVKAVVVRALAHPGEGNDHRAVRMGALGQLAKHPAWAKEHADAARAIFDSGAHEVERREALETLVAGGDPKSLTRIPAYFHDASAGVRSTASSVVSLDKPDGKLGLSRISLLALTAGYFSAEPDVKGYEARLRLAFSTIRQQAGAWVGLPEKYRTKGGSMNEVADAVHTLLISGSLEGTTRAQVAEAHFRWLAAEAKLTPAEIDEAVKARGEFWSKAFGGDVAGAKKVYDAIVGSHADLWTYERGWLMARGAI